MIEAPLPLRPSGSRARIAIVGGGFAAAEAVIALRAAAGARVAIDLVSPQPDLRLRPLAVTAWTGPDEVRRVPLAELCADHDATLHLATVTFADALRRRLETRERTSLPFDAAILAPGARTQPAVPGATVFDGWRGIVELHRLVERDDPIGTIVFAVPSGVTWSLPAYELALLTSARAAGRAKVVVVTPERAPLDVFGDAASRRVAELLTRQGVELVTATEPRERVARGLRTDSGLVRAEHVVALPRLRGPALAGVPLDANGFIPVDDLMRVDGTANLYAAGDAIGFPVKQGGLAAQQADVAADAIAARVGAPVQPRPFRPVLRAMLLTGSLPLYLRGEGDAGAAASDMPLWRPLGKVAAPHLAPWLAERQRSRLGAAADFTDLPPAEGTPAEHDERVALALELADDEAASGDPKRALEWLDAVEAIGGVLPAGYAEKRGRWSSVRAAT